MTESRKQEKGYLQVPGLRYQVLVSPTPPTLKKYRGLNFQFKKKKKKFETKIVLENINKRDQGFKVTTPFFLYYLFTPISQPY